MLCIPMLVDEGKKLEEELNNTGPGEAFYIKCDVSKEDEIKVRESVFQSEHSYIHQSNNVRIVITANTVASGDFCHIILSSGLYQ